ncbi:MAG: galactitol-1-phosphate 5-dehydrogenase [Clostridia bacterium]|nr:galactitol-1-phosphate 5-dehydrogenase [Clostridia bacterium]
MKAVKLYEAGDLRVEDVEIPELEAGHVLVKVKAVGVCGSDIPRVNFYGAYRPKLTIGHEFSGEITKVNEGSTWKVGDRVVVPPLIPCNRCQWCQSGNYSLCEDYSYLGSRQDGAMAEYVSVPESNLLNIPPSVPFEAAAMVDPAANAIHAIWKGSINTGDTVAIYGCGPIGLFAIQFAKILGAGMVIAIDIKDEKLQTAKELGADEIINSLEIDPVAKINEITGKAGANFVLETAGLSVVQNQAVCSAGKLGRIVILGISHDKLELSKTAADNLLRRELELRGSWNSFSSPFPGKEWTYSVELMAQGKLITEPIISHKLSLDEAPEIFKKFLDKNFVFSKVMFLP